MAFHCSRKMTFSVIVDRLDGFHPLKWFVWENSAGSRNQSDCRICWIPPARELKKHNIYLFTLSLLSTIMCFLWYKQQFLHSDWLKTCQLIPNQWNFTSAKLNHILYRNIKCNGTNDERYLRQDLLTIENTDSDTKVHALYYANELLVRVRLSFKNFFKLAQHAQAIRKQQNAWEKSNDAYSFSIREQTTKNHISIFTFLCFYHSINVKEVLLFQRTSWERHCATYWRKQRFCNFWLFWACACKLSWTLFSPTRVQPL